MSLIEQPPLRVFLSYSSKDRLTVRYLYNQLQHTRGVKPWFDDTILLPGEEWENEITRAVNEVDVVLVCLSPNILTRSGNINSDIVYALNQAKKRTTNPPTILLVKIESCDTPEPLRSVQTINWYDKYGYQQLVEALQAKTNRLLEACPPAALDKLTGKPGRTTANLDMMFPDMVQPPTENKHPTPGDRVTMPNDSQQSPNIVHKAPPDRPAKPEKTQPSDSKPRTSSQRPNRQLSAGHQPDARQSTIEATQPRTSTTRTKTPAKPEPEPAQPSTPVDRRIVYGVLALIVVGVLIVAGFFFFFSGTLGAPDQATMTAQPRPTEGDDTFTLSPAKVVAPADMITPTITLTPTQTPVRSSPISPTGALTSTQGITATAELTPTAELTATVELTATAEFTPTPTLSPTESLSPSNTLAPSLPITATDMLSPTTAVTTTLEPDTTPEPEPEVAPEPPPEPQPEVYVVQQGDTIGGIARQFDIPVREILQFNNLSPADADAIRPGQELLIPTAPPEQAGIRMPDVTGMQEDEARTTLEEAGIPSNAIAVQYQGREQLGELFDQVEARVVVTTQPAPGDTVESSATVVLTIRSENR